MIRKLELLGFAAFEHVVLDLVPGINVFLGANATGKTHAMKALYSALRAVPKEGSSLELGARLREKFARVFRPDDAQIGRLVQRRPGQGSARIRILGSSGQLGFSIYSKDSSIRIQKNDLEHVPSAIFLPSRELLAMYEGFIAAYQARELSFDETYFDGIVALSASALRGPKPKPISGAMEDLHKILGGHVVRQGDRFYLVGREGKLEAHLLAEGMRKLASVTYLLANGSLSERGVLFWDEPEANLNPALVGGLADLLVNLAKTGMQIVVATHDYLFTRTLALHSEQGASIRFFAFVRQDSGVIVTGASTPDELPENLIRDAFLTHYDRSRGVEDGAQTAGSRP